MLLRTLQRILVFAVQYLITFHRLFLGPIGAGHFYKKMFALLRASTRGERHQILFLSERNSESRTLVSRESKCIN